MIRKTITITSLAILVATISVATTMTMVQADITGDRIDFNIPTATTQNANQVLVGGGVEYSDSMQVTDAELTFTDAGLFDGIIDLSEIEITDPGVGVHSGNFDFGNGGIVTFTDTSGDNSIQSDELSGGGGVAVSDGSVFLTATVHLITVDVDEGTVAIDLSGGSPTSDDIVITIDDLEWQTEGPGAIGSFDCTDNLGATSIAQFDENTLVITITPDAVDDVIDIDCTYEAFHGDVDKSLDADCEVQIMDQFTTECSFTITYFGVPVNIVDSVPAEWEVTDVSNIGVPADALVTYTESIGADDIITSTAELVIDDPGVNVPNLSSFEFTGSGDSAFVLFTDGDGSGTVDGTIDHIDELFITNGGTAVVTTPQQASITADSFDTCSKVIKGNSGKAATGIECNDATNVDTTVTIETRHTPGQGHKDANRQSVEVFKPTFCTNGETFPVNDGVQAILLDGPGGDPVLSTLDGEPIVLDSTGELLATSVDTGDGLFDCDGELKPIS